MYNPETDCIVVSLNDEIHVSFNCQKCNASVRLNKPSDIVYLTSYKACQRRTGLYAKLVPRDDGLQGYDEAMGKFNQEFLLLYSCTQDFFPSAISILPFSILLQFLIVSFTINPSLSTILSTNQPLDYSTCFLHQKYSYDTANISCAHHSKHFCLFDNL